MLQYYKEKKIKIISIIVVLLDGIIMYLIPSYFNKLNYLYPMLTISLIPFIYVINKKRFGLLIILGIIYDLLYSSIFLYHLILFIILAMIDKKIIDYIKPNLWLFIILALLNIVIYDSTLFSLVILTNYSTITINDLLYKISHSILLNIMSVFVFWFMFKKDLYHA